MILHSTRFCIESSKIGKIHLSPNSVESVQVSHRIWLDRSHQVFLGVKLGQKFEPIWTQNPSHPFCTFLWIQSDLLFLTLFWCCWSNSSHFSFSPIFLFPSVEFFVIGIHQLMQHCKCGYVRHFKLLNEWTFELLNLTMLDETYWMKVCEWKYRVSSNIWNSVQNFIQHEY